MTAHPKVVIIGAGIVGASLADELALRGWTDVTVLDAGPLPAAGGSTSHAPGVVFQTNGSQTLSELAMATVRKFLALEWEGEPCFNDVGGLEIATTPERLEELKRRLGYAQSWGVPEARLLSPAECLEMWDLLNPELVLGGLFVPTDGVARALAAVSAQLARAAAAGVTIRDNTEVTDITVVDGAVTGVETASGFIPADIVVCAAGIWGRKIGAMVGVDLALTPLAHQLAWTEPVAELAGRTVDAVRPVLRHQDDALYYREKFGGIGIGSYHHRAMPVEASALRGWNEEVQPSILDFTPEDFAFALEKSAELIPALAGVPLAEAINGVFSFTPDGMPLLGPAHGVRGFWVAEAVWITHSAGVAQALAEWLVDGYCSSFDLHGCDVNRFEKYELAPRYLVAKDSQNFVEVYDILHPLQPMEHSRPLRTSPFFPRQQALGGEFLEAHGWERPHWYAANDALVTADSPVPSPDAWAARYWSPTVAAESERTRNGVALYDMTALKRLEVTGPGSTEFLQHMTTGNVAKSIGSVTYCLLLNADGGIRSDITVARLGAERYQIGANGEIDLHWLQQHLDEGPYADTVQIRDITPGTCCIGIWGPHAREVVQSLSDDDISNTALKYFRALETYLGAVPVTAMRLSYVGELGYELYTTADQGLALWDLLMRAGEPFGIVAAGRSAFNSLRIEKGYRSFGTDMGYRHDPYEAGLGFAVRLDKGDFLGRDALLARKENVTRTLALLVLDDPDAVVLGHEPVFVDGAAVGYVTSGAYAYTLRSSLAYAWLPVSAAAIGTRVQIEYFGRCYAATVSAEPAFDPEMTKIRR